jgi:ferredoxin/flavodoxin
MKNVIYYFSATGNSLNVAQSVQKCIKDLELINIAKVLSSEKEQSFKLSNIDRLGFVFPVYAWGMPRIVEDFLKKIKSVEAEYIFAIATCGGTPGKTLLMLDNYLKEYKVSLNNAFTVNEGAYTFLEENVFMNIIPKLATSTPKRFSDRKSEVIHCIKNKNNGKIESSGFLANGIGNTLHGFAIKNFKTMDEDFWLNDNCNDCNQCINICPRGNIDIKAGKRVWLNNCEFCFACLQWCPMEAIEYSKESIGKMRQHNSNIKIDELI